MQAAAGRRAAARAGSSGLLAQDADDATKKWLLFSFCLTGVRTESLSARGSSAYRSLISVHSTVTWCFVKGFATPSHAVTPTKN